MSSPPPDVLERSKLARVGDVTICYETFGEPSSPPIVLIMGLAAQMVVWDEDFCTLLASRGYFVIRFDNRDIGYSTRFDDPQTPSMPEVMAASFRGVRLTPRYTLRDMARDVTGLMDVLGIPAAHVVGLSMGGMIAQEVALSFRERIITLTSIMSSTGDPSLPPATPEAVAVVTRPYAPEKTAFVESYVNAWGVLNGDRLPYDRERTARTAALTFDRGINQPGVSRQMMAILDSGDRTARLNQLDIPALVIHGTIDPLVPPEAGRATARAIPNAKLVMIEGMGHTLPRTIWPTVVDAIAEHAR